MTHQHILTNTVTA